MNIIRRFLALLLLFFAFEGAALASPPVAGEALTSFDALNVAGRQRMLSQRVVKLYCQLLLGIRSAATTHALDEAKETFEAQLVALRSASKTTEMQQALQQQAHLWGEMRGILQDGVSHEGAKRLQEMSETLLESSQKFVTLLEKQRTQTGYEWIDKSGKQRMLSQRVAKLYLLKFLGIAHASTNTELEKARHEFNRTHESLMYGAQNNPDIIDKLQYVKTQWGILKGALDNGRPDNKADAERVVTSSDRVLAGMEQVTDMFEETYDTDD